MRFTDLFVRRPVLALVVSTLILLLGARALGELPVRQYPLTESTTLTITTQYPGASPELMQGFVTQPIAQAVATIENVDYLSSTSTLGRSVVSVRMKLNADANQALTQAMAQVSQVKYRLPAEAFDPVILKSSGEATAVAYVGFSSRTMPIPALTDYLSRVVQPQFASIPGVSSVAVSGGQTLAMRVWLDPNRLAARGISAGELADALRQNNVQATPGQVKGLYVVSNIRVNTDLVNVAEFRDMVVKRDGEAIVRLGDVATVELGAASVDSSATMDGDKAIYVGLHAAPDGNPLVIVKRIRELLPAVKQNLPPGVEVQLPFELARFIEASIDEVQKTLLEAVAIVVLVIFLCLGSMRAVLIPVVTIPLSMLGAAALMLLFGFSLNLLTLLAMVLAIGLVVDDAIVVVENVHRHMEEGSSRVQAALIGAREVAGPVIAMTLTLAAVYAPIGLMGGLTGSLFKEFAFTLAGAVVVSGVIALTLSPVMASFLLPQDTGAGRMARHAEAFFDWLSTAYGRLLDVSLHHRWVTGLLAAVVLVSLPFLYNAAQRELAPGEDQAMVMTVIKSPQHANIDYVEKFGKKWDEVLGALPENTGRWLVNGSDGVSNSIGGVQLSDWKDRQRSAEQIQAEVQAGMNEVEGSSVFAFQLPSLPGSTGGLPVQMVIRSAGDHRTVFEAMEALKKAARESGRFAVVDSDLEFNNPVTEVRVDRAKANSMGVTMKAIGDTLAVLVGENYVNRFGMDGRSYDVIPQSPRDQRLSAEALSRYFVKSASGQPVPLANLVQLSTSVGPNQLTQFNQLNAATFQAIPMPGVTMGDAVAFLSEEAKKLPAGFSYDWQSDARQFSQEGSALVMAFVFAIVVIYLVLAAQYESLRDPLIILISVPMSICGALVPLAMGFATVNIYTQIGLVTLIGLISKHGILMVEFANEIQARDNLDRRPAIEQAARIRLRPILMTTAAMVMGLVPLLFASGAGAASRFSIGLVIVVGMLVGTLFTLFVLPTMYTLLARDHRTVGRSPRAAELDALVQGA
ncbi:MULTISPECIES: MexW/MexI family multidrug efflux RND transporter permease subunit [unclassified Variovorax]|uniref:MexW/MexI family multidrug efflux RND transporter permease subunit n=1 Tax=unclassified Variovorax TaxID=663243 RepID=UPI00257583D7|nr:MULTISPECIES: MexW/MexI family multidrug efflux RND transporter permease subunit [unclassified Variovorax]MDM0086643.1 MexW/MexI family multidrug efflux RND transporter permease subunit [Variovorax sp. J22G40]MDM0145101.1 MexW/MexI family multidrug efflux RND transporter permease subunit [Variovorax sp. J2P1-31]